MTPEQCPTCFRMKREFVKTHQNGLIVILQRCLHCRHDPQPYLTCWRMPEQQAEIPPWVPPLNEATYYKMCHLYNQQPDSFGFIPISNQLDRMFWEDHQKVPTEGGSAFRRLEPTISVAIPNHLAPEIIAERFDIDLSDAKRLATVFQRLQFDWKVVWHHCKKHFTICKGDGELIEIAITYYEELAQKLPELEPMPTDDKILGIDGLNLFYSVY